jgi:trans-aconitate methyltransferase
MATDHWSGGDAYEAFIGRWSRLVAADFVEWLAIGPGAHWVDVGCGTGALSAAIIERANPASVVGVDPSADFVAAAGRRVTDARATFVVGDAGALPVAGGSAEVVVSGLVLNFIPDLPRALHEMTRVGRSRATVAAYVWDYADRMEPLRRFWDAAVALDPAATTVDEGVRFPICAPDPLRRAFEDAGLTQVAVEAIEVPTVFRDFDDYWTPFLSGVGPAPGYAMSLGDDARATLRERLRSSLPTAPDGTIHLVARAWAVCGRPS